MQPKSDDALKEQPPDSPSVMEEQTGSWVRDRIGDSVQITHSFSPMRYKPPKGLTTKMHINMAEDHDPQSGAPPKFYPYRDVDLFKDRERGKLPVYQSKSPQDLIAEVPPIEVEGGTSAIRSWGDLLW